MRVIALLAAALACLVCLGAPLGSAQLADVPTRASAAILMDVESGVVLQGKNVHGRVPIASLTKIMTALLAAESGKLDAVVVIPPQVAKVEPRNIWLSPGENITLRNLVYGLLMRSGNDAALAIAYFLAGSVEAFAAAMNARARELGALDSHFVNPNGLPNAKHLSTAYDMALITRALLSDRFLRRVVSTTRYRAPWEGRGYDRIWHNTNRLLQLMPGADGVKTGWTRAAGRCLAASATRQGWQLLAIVLNSPDHYGETRALLEWGFANYQRVVLVERGQYLGSVHVAHGFPSVIGAMAARKMAWVVPQGRQLAVVTEIDLPREVRPPVMSGSVIGQLAVVIEGRQAASIPLVADQAAAHTSWLRRLADLAQQYLRFLEYSLRWPA